MRWPLLLLLIGCAPEADPCSGATLEVGTEAVHFGDLTLLSGGAIGDPNTADQVPSRRTVLLRNACGPALRIHQVCLIQNEHNGEAGSTAFYLEGPDRAVLGPGQTAGLRLTFDAQTVSDDLNQDAERDPDRATLVIQSDAHNTPTHVIPVCARTVPEGEANPPYDCPAPFTIPAGEALPDLCDQ